MLLPQARKGMTMVDILDDDFEATIAKGNHAWITVGEFSLRIAHLTDGRAKIQVFPLGEEDAPSIDSIVVGP